MRQSSWQRILWKEFREGWPVIAAFIVLPCIVFPFGKLFPQSLAVQAMVGTVLFAVPFAAVLWASEKRRMVKQGRDVLAAVLPVSPLQDWAASFLMPAVAVGISGGCMYLLYTGLPNDILQPMGVADGVVIVVTAFMLSSFFSKSVSHVLGIILGTIWVLCTFPMFVGKESGVALLFFFPVTLAVAALCASAFRKAGPKRLRAFAVVVLGGLILVIALPFILDAFNGVSSVMEEGIFAPQGGVWMEYASVNRDANTPRAGTDRIVFNDYTKRQKGRVYNPPSHEFPSASIPAAGDTAKRVYVLTQRPGRREVTVSRWDPRSDEVATICRFAASRNALRYPLSWVLMISPAYSSVTGWVDPKGTKMLLRLGSAMGTGADLWLIDLTSGKHKLLLANALFAWDDVIWTKDRAFVVGYLPAMEVNTRDYTVRPLAPVRRAGR